jgi:HPt (histidine-containing phosphotransfer) domain-containing protein
MSSLAHTGDRATQIAEARGMAHQIAGAAGSIGFDRLSKLAALLEHKLVEVQEGIGPASKAQLAKFALLYAELERELQETKPELSRLYDTDLRDFVRTGT